MLLPDSNNILKCIWKGSYTALRKVNDTNYDIDLGHRVTFLHIHLLRIWNERENEVMVNIVIVEEEEDVE